MPAQSGDPSQPNAVEHLRGAASIAEMVPALCEVSPGWAVTATFYSAVHYLRSYLFASHGVRIARHDDMKQHWFTYPELRPIREDYQHLKQQSEQYRYYLVDFDRNDVAELGESLNAIRKFVVPKLARLGVLVSGPAPR